jgi:hypothetical protein
MKLLSEAPTLVVGDMHVTADELEDSQAVIDLALSLKDQYEVIVFLGDQFNSHTVLSLPVVDFWRRAVTALRYKGRYRQIHMRGNHDMAANGDGPHALEVYRELLDVQDAIVDGGLMEDGILFLGHYVKESDFLNTARKLAPMGAGLVVCHQAFDGAQAENGFYMPDGFDQNALPCKQIISGHVHRRAAFGKVVYEGSPRWRSTADAGEFKCLVGYPHGLGKHFVMHSTADVCKPIEILEDTEESSFQRRWDNSKLTVIVKGKPEWVKVRAADLETQGVAVHRRPDLRASAKVSESRPIGESMTAFMKAYRGACGTAGDRLAMLAAQRFT